MKKYPLLLTLIGNILVLIASNTGANAATLQSPVGLPDSLAQPPKTGIAPSDSNPTSPTDPTSPTFNPQGIQSILSSGGNLSNE